MDKLPVVYVRGYAGPTTGIDTAVDDPFYGFNLGGTHVRVNGDGDPEFYQFEGPMLRLMTDEGYQLLVRGGQDAYLKTVPDGGLSDAQASIWIYRFYDTAADTFTAPPKRPFLDALLHRGEAGVSAPGFNVEVAATGLYDFIKEILAKTGAPKVNLVAHSMGGLIARCMLQKISQTPDSDGRPRTPGAGLVDRFFTYATPHGGIIFTAGAINSLEQVVGPAGSEIFAPHNMYGYLTAGAHWGDAPPEGWDPRAIPAAIFDPDRIFCLIGTDPQDYGLPRVVVGPQSDGLVRIEDAQLADPDTHRAHVYRSHSGRYGIVNSEEGYQNLRRFLFGKYQVAIRLGAVDIASTGADTPAAADADAAWQADLRMSVRGLPVVMDEQLAAHYCPVELTAELASQPGPGGLVPLTTVFLLAPSAQWAVPGRCRFALQLRVFRVLQRNGFFDFAHHLEQVADWEDTLIADIGYPDGAPTTGEPQVWAAWNSTVNGVLAEQDPIEDAPLALVGSGYEIQLPDPARAILGGSSTLGFTVTERLPSAAS
jgi:pimeloyl-ACP methyl ester carboxylesterase